MRFHIFHRTRYHYRAPVRDSYNEVRLRPATADTARLEFFLLNVYPPVRLQHFRDPFLNYVHFFDIAEPHDELIIEARTVINTSSPWDKGPPEGVPFAPGNTAGDDLAPAFLNSSRYVEVTPELWRMAIDIQAGCGDVFLTARAIMTHIRKHFTYAPRTTTAATHVSEVLATRCGVCQDFTHVMIGLCRAIAIPARYVSGYLFDGFDPELRGAQASHAWCEILVPGHGWFGLDPTNNTVADERHIKIATGRDYHDAAPVSGHFDGPPGATSALQVDLLIEPLTA